MDGSDQELISRYIDGNTDALGILVRKHSGKLFGYVFNMTRDRATTEDIFQETWQRVIQKLDSYRADNFSGWVVRIAHNLVIDLYRRKKPDLSLDAESATGLSLANALPDPSGGPDRKTQDAELGIRIKKAVLELPPKQREVFIMRTEADLSFREICSIQGTSINTALARMQYAVTKLRTELEGEYEALKR